VDWADQERVRMAIVAIHAEARYYEGLDMLCELVGWKSFRCEGLYPAAEMDAWVRSKGGGEGLQPLPVKKRGWPKGKPRGPRKPRADVIQLTRTG
jgi:hypothetical protein